MCACQRTNYLVSVVGAYCALIPLRARYLYTCVHVSVCVCVRALAPGICVHMCMHACMRTRAACGKVVPFFSLSSCWCWCCCCSSSHKKNAAHRKPGLLGPVRSDQPAKRTRYGFELCVRACVRVHHYCQLTFSMQTSVTRTERTRPTHSHKNAQELHSSAASGCVCHTSKNSPVCVFLCCLFAEVCSAQRADFLFFCTCRLQCTQRPLRSCAHLVTA